MTEAQRKEYDFGSLEHRRADNDFSRLIRALGEFPPLPGEENVGMYDLILTLKKSRDHGECFYYADANPIAAQWMLELMGGRDFIAQMNEAWQQLLIPA
jgi:CubicO group peptidase (beta-lactamase class C family)